MAYFIPRDVSNVITYLSSANREATNYGTPYSLLIFPSSGFEIFS